MLEFCLKLIIIAVVIPENFRSILMCNNNNICFIIDGWNVIWLNPQYLSNGIMFCYRYIPCISSKRDRNFYYGTSCDCKIFF